MNVKDVIETEILSCGMDGEGVARVDGKVLFVPYTLKGERVRVCVKQVKKNYAFGTAIKILEPSAHRVEPECPHCFRCGGCDMGHIDGEYRRDVLLGELESNLKRIADIDYVPTEFVACDARAAVRNKISMPFGLCGGKVVLGMYKHNTHIVEPVRCVLQSGRMRELSDMLCAFANDKRLSVYDGNGNGLLRHLVLREIGDRVSATVVINARGFDGEAELAARLPDYCDFFVSENTRKSNVILGDDARLVKGNARLAVDVLGVKAELSPLSFFQVNDCIRDVLYSAAIAAIRSETLIDLYSGIGITSNLAAKRCESVLAVEIVPQAVGDADDTARLNGNAHKIRNICGNVERVLAELDTGDKSADVLVDPPRKGCGAPVMAQIARLAPRRLIYISCNHATMCRDIKVLRELSPEYELTECRMFDMFPNTHHAEILACLDRRDAG